MRIRAHPYIEQATMTGVSAAPTTAVSVVDNIKHVSYVAVVVIASDSSLRSFGGAILMKVTKECHRMPREKKKLRLRAPLYIEPAATTGVNAASITAVSVVGNIKHVWYVAAVVLASDAAPFVVLVALLFYGGP